LPKIWINDDDNNNNNNNNNNNTDDDDDDDDNNNNNNNNNGINVISNDAARGAVAAPLGDRPVSLFAQSIGTGSGLIIISL
jgi:hypothetical protein